MERTLAYLNKRNVSATDLENGYDWSLFIGQNGLDPGVFGCWRVCNDEVSSVSTSWIEVFWELYTSKRRTSLALKRELP